MDVQVLGTSFNVNAYEEEEATRTTLIEGSIKVKTANAEALLKPGLQASVSKDKALSIIHYPLSTDVIAWKNGLFRFDNQTIEPIMREISRWYGLKVEYKGKITDRFVSTIPRNASVNQVLNTLQLAGGVHFIVEGNKVTVTP